MDIRIIFDIRAWVKQHPNVTLTTQLNHEKNTTVNDSHNVKALTSHNCIYKLWSYEVKEFQTIHSDLLIYKNRNCTNSSPLNYGVSVDQFFGFCVLLF